MWLVLSNRSRPLIKQPTFKLPNNAGEHADTDAKAEDVLLPKSPPALSPGHCSWTTLLLMTACISIICSIDRTCMSVAILPMSAQYKWPDSTKGAVNGAFSIGYTVTNLLGGFLAALYGPKRVLKWGVLVWSVFTLLTPAAASTELWVLLLVRAAMGFGEGVTFPCVQVLVKTSIPSDRRARSLSLIYSGHQLGSIIALLTSPAIILQLGWPWVFYLFSCLGFIWLVGWQALVLPAPAAAAVATLPLVSPAGSSLVEQQQQQKQQPRPSSVAGDVDDVAVCGKVADKVAAKGLVSWSWRAFAAQPACWALLVAHCAFGVVYQIAMGWLPTYYNQQFGVNVRDSAWLSVLPFICMATTTNASGWIADGLVNSGATSTTTARKILQGFGTAVPASCLWFLSLHRSQAKLGVATALALLSFMLGGLGLQAAGYASNHGDIATRYAGLLYGITNAGSSFAGSVAVYAVGVVLDWTRDWGVVFGAVAWCNVLSFIVYLSFATSTQLFE